MRGKNIDWLLIVGCKSDRMPKDVLFITQWISDETWLLRHDSDGQRPRQLSISPFWLTFIPFFVLLCSAGSTLLKFSFPFYSESLSTLSNQNEKENTHLAKTCLRTIPFIDTVAKDHGF